MDLVQRIGVSTYNLMGTPFAEILNQIKGAGFKAVEINVRTLAESLGFEWRALQTLSGKDFASIFKEWRRKKLRDMLQPFQIITVHGASMGVKVRSSGKEGRAELWERYVELMRLAHDIGASVVTFHSIGREKGAKVSDEEITDNRIELGRLAARYADEWNLRVGYEFFNKEIITRIGSWRFGFLFDIDHAAPFLKRGLGEEVKRLFLNQSLAMGVLQMIRERVDRTVEFHLGGVYATPSMIRDHLPLDKDNCNDFARIVRLLRERNYDGPLIFEIFNGFPQGKLSPVDSLKACVKAKEQLLQL